MSEKLAAILRHSYEEGRVDPLPPEESLGHKSLRKARLVPQEPATHRLNGPYDPALAEEDIVRRALARRYG